MPNSQVKSHILENFLVSNEYLTGHVLISLVSRTYVFEVRITN